MLHNTGHYEITCGNEGLLTFYSDPWAQISYQTWVYLTVCVLIFLRIPADLIVSCCNPSCDILCIYSSNSEISTCLINNQTHDTKRMLILSAETLHDSENNKNKMPKPKFVHGYVVSGCLNVRTFAVCFHQKSPDTKCEI